MRAVSNKNGVALDTIHIIMDELDKYKVLYHNEVKKRNVCMLC